jgi:hypothetical protein
MRVAGFDPGRDYVAWASVVGDLETGFSLERHGILYPPTLGNTKHFGGSLHFWSCAFGIFLREDLQPSIYGIERFVYTPGGKGGGSEDINLRLPGMWGVGAHYVRNTDWKSWFKRNVDKEGAQHHFRLGTPHESDSAGIATYTACVLGHRGTT